jgi:hypothetical protein
MRPIEKMYFLAWQLKKSRLLARKGEGETQRLADVRYRNEMLAGLPQAQETMADGWS